MHIILKNKNERHLAQLALKTVLHHGPGWLDKPNANYYEAETPQGQLIRLHGGGRADVYLFIHRDEHYCLKWFHDSRLITKLRNGLGLSKALHSYKVSAKLQQTNVNAPKVHGMIQANRFAPPLLIMEMMESCKQLNLILEEWKKPGSDLCSEPRFTRLAEQFAKFTATLHLKKVLHQDFSPRNVLVKEIDNNFEFYLIDLEDVYFGTHPKDNLNHFSERLPRYLSKNQCHLFLKHFQQTYKNLNHEEFCTKKNPYVA